ncbi:MAG: radical SAM protein [Candidatus Spechtbacterales bacterium]
MKRILLVSPDFNPNDTKARYVHFRNSELAAMPLTATKSFMVPLGLATVAALTPGDITVDIWDEGVHGSVIDNRELPSHYDLVGVTGYVSHTGRMRELGGFFRARGVLTVAGGPDVSASPENYRDHFDVLFIGEAEHTWPQFITNWKAGIHGAEYREVTKIDMAHSPLPCWDNIAPYLGSYSVAAVQTTRGCPFDCEFCDVIYIFGRQARHKSIEQVLEEVRILERLGAENIFFCDDNFMGNPRYTKELLQALIPVNNKFQRPLGFHTQITLNVTEDDEMLQLLADANFTNLFVGIETPNVESLQAANKRHNLRRDIPDSVRKIHSLGMVVQAGMIVGFDQDDTTIFDRQFQFMQAAGIGTPMVNTLKAPPGTKLWIRMHKEGRIVRPRNVPDFEEQIGSDPLTNIVPAKMTRTELRSGYLDLVQRLRAWPNFEDRVKTMLAQIQRKPNVKVGTLSPRMLAKLPAFIRFLFSLDGEARGTVMRLTLHTLRHYPFMMGKVMGLIGRQYMLAAQVPDLVRVVDEENRLERETEGGYLERERTVFFLPDEFRAPFKDIFPGLYARVRQGLDDKSRTLNALVEATYDFLTRWGSTFHRFEEHHIEFLHEICDRTVAGENSQSLKRTDAGEDPDKQLASLTDGQIAIQLKRWADEVLRNVEQQLRGFQTLEARI